MSSEIILIIVYDNYDNSQYLKLDIFHKKMVSVELSIKFHD
jgi:hypothetical protein